MAKLIKRHPADFSWLAKRRKEQLERERRERMAALRPGLITILHIEEIFTGQNKSIATA